jgi:hypothetical protein
VDKLQREPVEDFRIDFEDGFGNRLGEEEDRFAGIAARQVAEGMADRTLPPGIGIRIKPRRRRAQAPQPADVRPVPDRASRIGNNRRVLPPQLRVLPLPKESPSAVTGAVHLASACERVSNTGAATPARHVAVRTDDRTTAIRSWPMDGSVALPR